MSEAEGKQYCSGALCPREAPGGLYHNLTSSSAQSCFLPLLSTGVTSYALINILHSNLHLSICFQRFQPGQWVRGQLKQCLFKQMWHCSVINAPKESSLVSCSHVYTWRLSLYLLPGWWPKCGTQLLSFIYIHALHSHTDKAAHMHQTSLQQCLAQIEGISEDSVKWKSCTTRKGKWLKI